MRVGRVLRDASAVGRGRRPVSHSYPADGPTRASHDRDQCRRSAAAEGVRAKNCSTCFLGWTLLGWLAAASCSVIGVCHQ